MNIQEIKKSYEEKLKQLQESLSLLGQYDDNEDVINITSNRLFLSNNFRIFSSKENSY